MKKVREIMTSDPVCCTPQDSVTEAAQLMKREDVGSVPVVKDRKTKKLVGIVTDRDLALKVLAEGRDPNNIEVEAIMTRSPVTCREDDDLESCLDGMEKHQIRRMPIVDAEQTESSELSRRRMSQRAAERLKKLPNWSRKSLNNQKREVFMNGRLALITGIGFGAGLMYILDPAMGRRRRALVVTRPVHAWKKTSDAVGATARDVSNRAAGLSQKTAVELRVPRVSFGCCPG